MLWTVDGITSVSSSDLTSWARNLVTNRFTVDSLSCESSWTLNVVADTVFLNLSLSTFSVGSEFFLLVALVSNLSVTI